MQIIHILVHLCQKYNVGRGLGLFISLLRYYSGDQVSLVAKQGNCSFFVSMGVLEVNNYGYVHYRLRYAKADEEKDAAVAKMF